MRIAIVGAGTIGARAARQLAEMPGVRAIRLIDHEPGRAAEVAQRIGPLVTPTESDDPTACAGSEAILVALPPVADETFSVWAISNGVPVATVGASPTTVDAILEAGAAGTSPVIVGAGALPGLTDVLVRHAAALFDRVDEIRIAGSGVASSTSASVIRTGLAYPMQVRDGKLESVRAGVSQVAWFPEPIGERECMRSPFSVKLLHRAFPEVPSISVWTEEPPRKRKDDWGASRVEVWGMQGDRHTVVTYGFAERIPSVTAVTGAIATAIVGGLLPELVATPQLRVGSLGEWVRPIGMLSECARRGIMVATFTGDRGR